MLQISVDVHVRVESRRRDVREAKIGKMWVNGIEVTPSATFRVTMNNFLATGGDGFTVFNEGTNPLGGAIDLDALVAYFAANQPAGIAVPPLGRIVPIP